MGTDCNMVTNKKRVDLDRLYCFSTFIETNKIYNKQDFIKLNLKCIQENIPDEFFGENFTEKDVEDLLYVIKYNIKAIENADELNMIVDDNDDRYYDDNFLIKQKEI